jgi:NADPH-dependent 2,4-dienoyl-CoA reductase/sulfur reductase-like enzyme
VLLATGARERFLPFSGWTLPGVVGVGAAQALLKMGAAVRGKRAIVAGAGPLVLPVAASLARAGARLSLVAEQASPAAVARFTASLWRRPRLLLRAARYRAAFARARYVTGTWVTAAEGKGRVQLVTVTDGRSARSLDCDLLCIAYGLVASTELARLAGCTIAGGAVVVDERQQTSVPGIYGAGEVTGIGGADLALLEGEIAGLAAAGEDAAAARLFAGRTRWRVGAVAMERAFAPRAELRGLCTDDTIVCRCEDVPRRALHKDWTARQAKLYTRAGMGPCQGRVCGAALEFLFGWTPDSVRAPIEPILLSTFLADVDSPPSLADVPTLHQGAT